MSKRIIAAVAAALVSVVGVAVTAGPAQARDTTWERHSQAVKPSKPAFRDTTWER
jgi:hypothetical protein